MGSFELCSLMSSAFALRVCVVSILFGVYSAQLSPTFYDTTCPNALSTIGFAVKSAVANEARMGASLLRLHFHDCFVNGCDASILLDDNSTFIGEKTASPNFNASRGYDVIDTIKSNVESICPGVVSCADILAVVARDSVVALGGPSWTVLLGRRDATTANSSAVTTEVPGPAANLDALISAFSRKGLSAKDLVALSGAHTIGQSRCLKFRTRIYNDTNIDSYYAASLRSNCPSSVGRGDTNIFPLETTNSFIFDNAYFTNLVNFKGLLHSDQELYGNKSTDSQVLYYSSNSDAFFRDFASAMVKMGNLSPLTGSAGEIRTSCRVVN